MQNNPRWDSGILLTRCVTAPRTRGARGLNQLAAEARCSFFLLSIPVRVQTHQLKANNIFKFIPICIHPQQPSWECFLPVVRSGPFDREAENRSLHSLSNTGLWRAHSWSDRLLFPAGFLWCLHQLPWSDFWTQLIHDIEKIECLIMNVFGAACRKITGNLPD